MQDKNKMLKTCMLIAVVAGLIAFIFSIGRLKTLDKVLTNQINIMLCRQDCNIKAKFDDESFVKCFEDCLE